MSRSDLSGQVRRLWHARFPDFARCQSLVRHLTDGGHRRFTVLFHPSRERLQALNTTLPAGDGPCPLDTVDPGSALHFRRWIVTPNRFPVQEEHILLILREHRAAVTAADVLDAMAFARETGYRLLLNLRGSGAAVPQHLHWQGLRMTFPICRPDCVGELVMEARTVVVNRLAPPWSGRRMLARSAKGCETVAALAVDHDGPFNLLIDGSAVYTVPRAKEYPSLFPGFKFGGAEVTGVVYAKSMEMLERMNLDALAGALSEVTATV